MILVMIKLQRAPWWKIRREEKKNLIWTSPFVARKDFISGAICCHCFWVSFFNEHLCVKKRELIRTFDELYKKNPTYRNNCLQKVKDKESKWAFTGDFSHVGHDWLYGETCKTHISLCHALLIVGWMVAHQHYTILKSKFVREPITCTFPFGSRGFTSSK